MDNEMDKLNVVLTEYKALRDEIIDNFRLHLQIYSIYTSALLIFYGLIFIHKIYDLILVIPIFSLSLFFRILWEQIIIRKIEKYIRYEIEKKKIPMIIGRIKEDHEHGYANLWMGWQHFWKEIKHPKYYKYSLFTLFLIVSVLPAVLYSIYSIFDYLKKVQIDTKLPIEIHLPFLILNLLIGCYMVCKIKRM